MSKNELLRPTIYDTILRDGRQDRRFELSVSARLQVVKLLDRLGIDYIEGGWPGAAETDSEFFNRVRDTHLEHAKIAAFGSTRRAGVYTEEDPVIKHLLNSKAPVCTLVGKSSLYHVQEVLHTTPEENLRMIGESIKYLKEIGREVGFDAEHYFDGFKKDSCYAIDTLEQAALNEVNWIALCDTNGGTMPWEVENIVEETIQSLGIRLSSRILKVPSIGIHAHNDTGCAVANTLSAFRAGANHIQGTINGYGERTGNTNLITVLGILQTKLGVECILPERLTEITQLSRTISALANCPPDPKQPFVGEDCFAHKAGLHADAVRKDPSAYEHIDPSTVGNSRHFVVSEYGGKGTAKSSIEALGLGFDVTDDLARQVINQVKINEARGFRYEEANASFELLVRRLLPDYQAPFLVHMSESLGDQSIRTFLSISEDHAHPSKMKWSEMASAQESLIGRFRVLQQALETKYPFLNLLQLENYHTQTENGKINRVFIQFYDGQKKWTTVSADANNVKASWMAVAEGIEFALLHPPY